MLGNKYKYAIFGGSYEYKENTLQTYALGNMASSRKIYSHIAGLGLVYYPFRNTLVFYAL